MEQWAGYQTQAEQMPYLQSNSLWVRCYTQPKNKDDIAPKGVRLTTHSEYKQWIKISCTHGL